MIRIKQICGHMKPAIINHNMSPTKLTVAVANEVSNEVSASNYIWHRCANSDDLREVMSLVEPNVWNLDDIVTLDPVRYRSYIARHTENGSIDAIAIACLLPRSKVLHIEDFALHPRIRERGLSRPLYQSWRLYLSSEWPESRAAGAATLIEVYLQNLEAWRIIMGVKEVLMLLQDNKAPLFIAKRTPIRVCAAQLTDAQAIEAYAEFQDWQRKTYRATLKQNKH